MPLTESFKMSLTADPSGLLEGLREASGAFRAFAETARGGIGDVEKSSSRLINMKSALAPAVAAFSGMGEGLREGGLAAVGLAGSMGATAQEASILGAALGDLGFGAERCQRAITDIAPLLGASRDAFESLGINIEGAAGKLEPLAEMTLGAADGLNGLELGSSSASDRMAQFGLSWATAGQQVMQGGQAMDGAAASAENLNAMMGGGAGALKKIKSALGDSAPAMKGAGMESIRWLSEFAGGACAAVGVAEQMAIRIGEAGAPFNELASAASSAATAIQGDMRALESAVGNSMRGVAASVAKDCVGAWADFAGAGETVLGDFDGAEQREKPSNTTTIEAPRPPAMQRGTDLIGQETNAARQGAQGAIDLEMERERLAESLDDQGRYHDAYLALEKQFWREVRGAPEASFKEREGLEAKLLEVERATASEGLASALDALGIEQAELVSGFEYKKSILQKELGLRLAGANEEMGIRQKLQDAGREMAIAQARVAEDLLERQRELRRAELADESDLASRKTQMGLATNAQCLENERRFINYERTIHLETLEWRKQGNATLIEEAAKLEDELTAIGAEAERKRRALEMEAALERKAMWNDIESTIQSSTQQSFMGLINGTMSWGDATRSLLNNVLQSFIRTSVAELTQHMTIQNLKTLFTAKKTTERVAIEASGTATASAAEVAGAGKSMIASAWAASAAAFKAMAGIPVVGPALAVGAGAAALAAVMAMVGKLNSAEGGWGQVPSDQLAMIHKNEMILPEKYASPMREMLEDGEMPGGSPINISISAVDAASVEKLFMSNGPALARAIKAQARDFAFA